MGGHGDGRRRPFRRTTGAAQYSKTDENWSPDINGIRYYESGRHMDPRPLVGCSRFSEMIKGRSAGFIDGLFATHPPSRQTSGANRSW